jgi:hypothetical protein
VEVKMVSGKGRKQNSAKHKLLLKRFTAIFVFSTFNSIHFNLQFVKSSIPNATLLFLAANIQRDQQENKSRVLRHLLFETTVLAYHTQSFYWLSPSPKIYY